MGDGIAHFGWRGQKSPKLKKKIAKNLVPIDFKARCTWDLGGRRQRISRNSAKGTRGAAPLVSYWCKYAFS